MADYDGRRSRRLTDNRQIVTRSTDDRRPGSYSGRVDTWQKDNPEDTERDTWPDERVPEKRETGSSDPYLAGLARQGRSVESEAVCSTPFDSRGWTGEERRGQSVDSFDPYIVELTRPNRSEF
jgi:hypothetical protein